MEISKQIEIELNDKAKKINNVKYGKVSFVIQDSKVVRAEIQEGWITKKVNK